MCAIISPFFCNLFGVPSSFFFFFFNDTATTEIYTLSLHDALPIYLNRAGSYDLRWDNFAGPEFGIEYIPRFQVGQNSRSEEHTSELQSRLHLVCRLLLEKKKNMDPHLYDAFAIVGADAGSTSHEH